MTNPLHEILQRFDNRFKESALKGKGGIVTETEPFNYPDVKSFISQEYTHLLEQLLKEIGEKEVEVKYDNPILEAQCTAYNQGIYDVKKLVTSRLHITKE